MEGREGIVLPDIAGAQTAALLGSVKDASVGSGNYQAVGKSHIINSHPRTVVT